MEMSRFRAPDRKTIARDRDPGSPTTRAVTGDRCLPIGCKEAWPQARWMQHTSASLT